MVENHSLNVCVIGAGFVGLTLAGKILKNTKTSVFLLENNLNKCREIENNIFSIHEPGLSEVLLFAKLNMRLKISSSIQLEEFDAVFVCIGTQPNSKDPDGAQKLIDLVLNFKNSIKKNGQLFIRSTVQLGLTEKISKILYKSRPDINVAFAPERTVEGVALIELDKLPQILGPTSTSDRLIAEKLLNDLGFDVILASNSTCAEFIKLISNSWRDTQFSISNEIAKIAEKVGVNPYEAIHISNFNYPRSQIPLPGPVGGPCLSKDTHILFDSFGEVERKSSILFNARVQNEALFQHAIKLIETHQIKLGRKITVLFLGGSFKGKPITNDVRNGLAETIILKLQSKDYYFYIWDPNLVKKDVEYMSAQLVNDFGDITPDIVVFGNNNSDLISLEIQNYLSSLNSATYIIDFWGITTELKLKLESIYIFGRGHEVK